MCVSHYLSISTFIISLSVLSFSSVFLFIFLFLCLFSHPLPLSLPRPLPCPCHPWCFCAACPTLSEPSLLLPGNGSRMPTLPVGIACRHTCCRKCLCIYVYVCLQMCIWKVKSKQRKSCQYAVVLGLHIFVV